jgi:DNA-binding NtrC family response regulator
MAEAKYPQNPILIVDDEAQALTSFEMTLRSANLNNFVPCRDSREVMALLEQTDMEIMLLDLNMPHIKGDELLPQITAAYPEIPVIVITGTNDVETAVKCMQHDAFDYILKPVEKSRLIGSVRRAIEIRELQRENRRLRESVLTDKVANPKAFAEIVTASPKIRSIFRYIESVATSPRPVLITGDTGVGKELIARAVHRLSLRSGEFIPVNVAGLDDNIFADTLFGHSKGAFTDAREPRSGLIENAAGGTLFLDEIGDLSSNSQVKLLRLLQDGGYLPLGADVAKRSDARILVATNQDLDVLQSTGKFRRDLFYRLCAHRVSIPPLRDRKEDIPALLDHFLALAAQTFAKKKPTAPDELLTLLATYHFPGNVRELESMVFDAVASHQSGKLSMQSFKAHIAPTPQSTEFSNEDSGSASQDLVHFADQLPTLKQTEQLLIDEAMRRADNNQSIAALSLGISRQALNKRLRKGTSK